jgi:PIN like domain
MRLLIDEDTAVQLVEPLRHVLLGHEVAHISDLSWKGKKDVRVLPDAKSAGYHVLITRDRAQFSDPRECDAIKKSGLHHVRYSQREGARGLALALGAIIAAMPILMEELEIAAGQRLVQSRASSPGAGSKSQTRGGTRRRPTGHGDGSGSHY